MSDRPIRVLALCDSPTTATGFAMVSRNVLRGLKKRGNYEIDVIGINYLGDYYDREKHPYNIFPACPQGYSDMYGRGRLLNALNGVEENVGLKRPWDIIFTIQDPFVIEGLGINVPFAEQLRITSALWKRQLDPSLWFKWIGYFPVDAEIKENWVSRSIALADYPVAYCDWGKLQMLKYEKHQFETMFTMKLNKEDQGKQAQLITPPMGPRMSVIPHGVATETFYPLPKEEVQAFRKEYFGDLIKDDTFLVVNVSRNQPRKDLPRTMAAFAAFKERVPNSFLYLHCKAEDLGGSIHEIARNFGMVQGQDYSTPKNFSANTGYPIEMVNKIYNAADLCVTTTLGEGWGFITTEAMATKTPIIAPNITSIFDIFNSYDYDDSIEALEDPNTTLRGIPAKAGSTSSEWICMGLEDNERVRPLTNVDNLVDKMCWVYKNKDSKALNRIVDNAYQWVQTMQWERICEEWHQLFQKAYAELESDRKIGAALDKTNRNDPCPCGSGEKFKRCHGSEDKLARYRDWLGK